MKKLLIFLLTSAALCLGQTAVSPFMGVGTAQFFDNNGVVLTSGVLYSFQAGTSTQQATYSDATGTTLNPNPIPLAAGGRVNIWLASGSYYKFQLCLQNDGPFCAPADVLFSVDQVPGGSSGSSGGGGSPFISGSSNPATSGILRLASGDTVCWRNAAGSANLCLTTDTSDVLTWLGGSIKMAETTCSNTGAGFDYLCADSSTHRWKMAVNGGAQYVLAIQGADINNFDQITQWHFGSTPTPLSTTPPTSGQALGWNGTNIVGIGPIESVFGWGATSQTFTSTATCSLSSNVSCALTTFPSAHTLIRFTFMLSGSPSGCAGNEVIGVRDLTTSTNLTTATITNGETTGYKDSGTLSVATTAGDTIGVGLITAASGCATWPTIGSLQMVYK